MLNITILFTALAALTPIASASVLRAEYRSVDTSNGNQVLDSHILAAFDEAGHPDAKPVQTWADSNGTVYREHYIFDTEEWNSMQSSLLGRFGISPATLSARDLLTRAPSDPPVFFCDGYESHPAAYTFTLGSVAASVCQAFVYGAEQAGKTQVIRQNVPTIQNANAIALFKYTWKTAQWATATTCGVAMSYGINTACEKIEDGAQGSQPATRGFRESYGSDCDASMEIDAA